MNSRQFGSTKNWRPGIDRAINSATYYLFIKMWKCIQNAIQLNAICSEMSNQSWFWHFITNANKSHTLSPNIMVWGGLYIDEVSKQSVFVFCVQTSQSSRHTCTHSHGKNKDKYDHRDTSTQYALYVIWLSSQQSVSSLTEA